MSDYFETPKVDMNGIYHYRGVKILETTSPSKYHVTRLWIAQYNATEKAYPEENCPHFNCIAHAVQWIDSLMDAGTTEDDVSPETPKTNTQAN